MAGVKTVIPPTKIFNAVTIGSNQTSTITDISQVDNVGIELVATGTPTGTFLVEVSNDYFAQGSTVVTAGNWVQLTLPSTPTLSGAAANIFIDLQQLSAAYLRVSYVFGSSTGTLNGFLTGKSV